MLESRPYREKLTKQINVSQINIIRGFSGRQRYEGYYRSPRRRSAMRKIPNLSDLEERRMRLLRVSIVRITRTAIAAQPSAGLTWYKVDSYFTVEYLGFY